MFEKLSKFVTYYAATIGVLWTVNKTATHFEVSIYVMAISAVTVALAVAVYVWLETRSTSEAEHKPHMERGELSFLLDVAQALENVRYASADDEGIAHLANRIVRSDLDKWAIKYDEYKKFRKKNPLVFSAIVSDNNELIGFFDVFPLTEGAANKILSGKIKERDITEEDIVPVDMNRMIKNIYIASVLFNKKQKRFIPKIAKEIVTLKLYGFLFKNFAPLDQLKIIAYAHTKPGENMLTRAQFRMILRPEDNVQKRPLFVLEPGQATAVRERYERICKALEAIDRGRRGDFPASESQPNK